MYYSVQSRHFDNYLDNSKTAYFALRRYTSGLIGEQTANLKAKSDNARRENPGPPYDCPVFWASETERVFGAKTNYFYDPGKRRNSAAAGRVFGAPRATEKTPRASLSIYRSREPGRDRTPSWIAFVFVRFFLSGKTEEHSPLSLNRKSIRRSNETPITDGALGLARTREGFCVRQDEETT
jgi:hypothetical protein